MQLILNQSVSTETIKLLCLRISEIGFKGYPVKDGITFKIIIPYADEVKISQLKFADGVKDLVHISTPFKLSSREAKHSDTIINVGDVAIGGEKLCVIAGPCAVESMEQIRSVAKKLSDMGVNILRGGVYKPRTSPYAFQGLREEGLEYLADVKKQYGLKIITEVIDTHSLGYAQEVADILQIGARNMQNFELLKAVGKTNKPVMLKRGMSATIHDLLMSAEYIMSEGNTQVILCERGIRTFETATRNTLDLNAIPLLKQLSHLPVIVDPSHGTGIRELVEPMACAGVAAGAHGVMVEVHCDPENAFSDGMQSLVPSQFNNLYRKINRIASALK